MGGCGQYEPISAEEKELVQRYEVIAIEPHLLKDMVGFWAYLVQDTLTALIFLA